MKELYMRRALIIFSAVLLCLVLGQNTALAQSNTNYKIAFEVKGWADTIAYLGYYYGESTYIKDTARVDSNGKFVFSNNIVLPQGVYFLILDKSKIFDILVGENQQFEITTDTANYVVNMKVKSDVNNQVFLDNMLYNIGMNSKAQPHLELLKDSTSTEKDKTMAREQLTQLNNEVNEQLANVIEKNKGLLISDLLKARQKVEIPEELRNDREKGYQYYKMHYWDNFDVGNNALLRLPEPLYRKKLDDYFDNLFLQSPDTLIPAIDKLITQAKRNKETYKFMVWNITIKYQNPKYMGQDAVFIHLYDNYFANGEMDFWANESLKGNLQERADQLRKSQIGKVAPNLIMLDQNLKRKSLYGLNNKFTVLYFYDPDCGHCKKETPKLDSFYKTTKYDVEVFAVCADTSMVKMKKYISDYDLSWVSVNGPRSVTPNYHQLYDATTTPSIYILDDKKKIIAKKFPDSGKIEEFLDNYTKSSNSN